MANLITLVRFVLLFPLIVMAYVAPPDWQLIDAPLLILILALDGLARLSHELHNDRHAVRS